MGIGDRVARLTQIVGTLGKRKATGGGSGGRRGAEGREVAAGGTDRVQSGECLVGVGVAPLSAVGILDNLLAAGFSDGGFAGGRGWEAAGDWPGQRHELVGDGDASLSTACDAGRRLAADGGRRRAFVRLAHPSVRRRKRCVA